MADVLETHPDYREHTDAEALCARCGALIFSEKHVTGTAVRVPFRMVQGSFLQAVDADGNPTGAWWPFCGACVSAGDRTLPLEHLRGS